MFFSYFLILKILLFNYKKYTRNCTEIFNVYYIHVSTFACFLITYVLILSQILLMNARYAADFCSYIKHLDNDLITFNFKKTFSNKSKIWERSAPIIKLKDLTFTKLIYKQNWDQFVNFSFCVSLLYTEMVTFCDTY